MKNEIQFMKLIVKKYDDLKNVFNEEILDVFFSRLPEQYFILTDFESMKTQLNRLPDVIMGKSSLIEINSDYERFIIVKNDLKLLRELFLKLYSPQEKNARLLRIYRDIKREFLIISYFITGKELDENSKTILKTPEWHNLKLIQGENVKYLNENHGVLNGKFVLKFELANVPSFSLLKNIWESIEDTSFSYIRLWMIKDFNKKYNSLYKIKILFEKHLDSEHIDSINEDIFRYVQSYMETRSIFDILGPSMIGPSSSHTAGANLIGQVARKFYESIKIKNPNFELNSIKILLMGSFRDTGLGHNTPQAILGGLSGLSTSSDQMMKTGNDIINGSKICFHDAQVKFTGFYKGSKRDDKFYEYDNNSNIVEITFISMDGEISLTGFSVGGGNIEIRYLNRRPIYKPITGDNIFYLNLNKPNKMPIDKDSCLKIEPVRENIAETTAQHLELEYNTFEEMMTHFGPEILGDEFAEQILNYEKMISGEQKKALIYKTEKYWEIMASSIFKGLNNNKLTGLKLSGDDAKRLDDYFKLNPDKDTIYTKAARYAIAVNEINAKNGLIIACPTGGSCGILPGVTQAWKETCTGYSEEAKNTKIREALLVAGFLGMILFDDVKTAGADLGCQAEIGGGTAMAAAAFVCLENGNLSQMLNAFTLSLKNCMGLVCDPVAGLVEVPCVKRNGIYSSLALTAGYMGLAGVESKISIDEVVLAIKEVGERMPAEYKETALGGLAKTRDGKKIDILLKEKNKHFFRN